MSEDKDIVLDVRDLRIGYRQGSKIVCAVDGASFSLCRGELLALVGESGSGKSVSALSLLGLLPKETFVVEGGVAMFGGRDLLAMDNEELRKVRGNRISMIFQEPMTALNPVLTIGWQIGEVLRTHRGLNGEEAKKQVLTLLERVGIPSPEQRYSDYPHQLSGGMRQRVMIAIALACRTELLIADEPTTALDVTVQAQIMDLLSELRREYKTSVLFITHNLGLVRQEADHVAVMVSGRIVERGTCDQLFSRPSHPYTRLLLRSVPGSGHRGSDLASIPGTGSLVSADCVGCCFASRCPDVIDRCKVERPGMSLIEGEHQVSCHLAEKNGHGETVSSQEASVSRERSSSGSSILSVRDIRVWFPVKTGLLKRTVGHVKAVDGVGFELSRGETLALVGESGCGKTTVGKSLLGLVPRTSGEFLMRNKETDGLEPIGIDRIRRRVQMIFQDPFSSLNPRMMVEETLSEGLEVHKIGGNARERKSLMVSLIERVGLSPEALQRYPHQFSGGQRQRIGLARALAVKPEILVCDECTSALDVSVQAQILNLLRELQASLGISYIFITHDLSVVSYLADRVAVMYLGRLVETGRTCDVLGDPKHPYAKALLSAVPSVDADSDGRKVLRLSGEVPSALKPPTGCHFHPRCPLATEQCRNEYPPSADCGGGHSVCCWQCN